MLPQDLRVGQGFFEGAIKVFCVGVADPIPDRDPGVMGLEGLIC